MGGLLMTRLMEILLIGCLVIILGCKSEEAVQCGVTEGPNMVQFSLEFDEDRLTHFGINEEQVYHSFRQKLNTFMGSNRIDLTRLDSVVVGTDDGAPVFLVDVAEVKCSFYRDGEPWDSLESYGDCGSPMQTE
jgi:hypothetical protein